MVVGELIDGLREAGLADRTTSFAGEQKVEASMAFPNRCLLLLDDARYLLRYGDRVLSPNFALQVAEIVDATRILREAVQRELQQLADAHAAFLQDEYLPHPRWLQVMKVLI